MNAADTMLAAGFNGLLAVAGETLTFGAQSVSAVVNRTPGVDSPRAPGVPDFSMRNASRIEIQTNQLGERPKAGWVFVDGSGAKHRVKEVIFSGDSWICECEVTP